MKNQDLFLPVLGIESATSIQNVTDICLVPPALFWFLHADFGGYPIKEKLYAGSPCLMFRVTKNSKYGVGSFLTCRREASGYTVEYFYYPEDKKIPNDLAKQGVGEIVIHSGCYLNSIRQLAGIEGAIPEIKIITERVEERLQMNVQGKDMQKLRATQEMGSKVIDEISALVNFVRDGQNKINT